MKRFKDFPDFTPDLTPKEVFQMGAFGGTYFRKIKSGITEKVYEDAWKEFPKSWFTGLDISTQVASPDCDKKLNKYKVKSGSSLEFWEKKGWIREQDPFGWFQWYCRFYTGRRSDDDVRQIERWKQTAGKNSRFRRRLENMLKQGKDSKKIRQLLIQWAVDAELVFPANRHEMF